MSYLMSFFLSFAYLSFYRCDFLYDDKFILNRDLKRYRALLRDAQTMLEQKEKEGGGKAQIRQLKNQVCIFLNETSLLND